MISETDNVKVANISKQVFMYAKAGTYLQDFKTSETGKNNRVDIGGHVNQGIAIDETVSKLRGAKSLL